MLVGRAPLFFGVRSFAQPGAVSTQVQELRSTDGRLVASLDSGAGLAMAPDASRIASLTEKVELLDGAGKSLGAAPGPASPGGARFDLAGSRLAVWGTTNGKPDVRVVDVETRRELLARAPAGLVGNPPIAFAAGGKRLVLAEGEAVRVVELDSGKVLKTLPVQTLASFAASESAPLLLTTVNERDAAKNVELSTVRIFDLGSDPPRLERELVLPKVERVLWAPGGKGFVALTAEAMLWVPRGGALPRARLEVLPYGIVARWDDGVVEPGAGAHEWLLCESGGLVLPALACLDRFVALDGSGASTQRELW